MSTKSDKIHSSEPKSNNNDKKAYSPSHKSAAHFSFPTPPFILGDREEGNANKQRQRIQQKERPNEQIPRKNVFQKTIPVHFLVLALSLACLSLIVANSLALNFTVICMQNEPSATMFVLNSTSFSTVLSSTSPEFNGQESVQATASESMFSLIEQSWLFSAVAIGQLLGSLPVAQLFSKFGMRNIFTLYGMISAISTLFIPPSIFLAGFPALMVMRICQGIGLASIWVATGAVSGEWCPPNSSAIFLAFLTSNLQFGPIIAMPLGAAFCSSPTLGWPSVFYLLGTVSVVVFCVFYLFFRDSPRQKKLVSACELAILEAGKCPIESGQTPQRKAKSQLPVPYRAILLDLVFWGIFASTAASNLGFQVFWQYGPLYLNKALGLEMAKTGMAAALPFVLSAVVKISAGQISDRVAMVSEKTKVIFFASVSQYMMASCFLVMALLPKFGWSNVTLIQCVFTAAIVFSGLNSIGIIRSTQQVSRHLSHVLFSWNTLMLSVIMLLLPLAVSLISPNGSVDEWADLFLFVTASIVAGTSFFNFYAEVEPREWAKVQNLQPSSKVSMASTAVLGTTLTSDSEEEKEKKKGAEEAK